MMSIKQRDITFLIETSSYFYCRAELQDIETQTTKVVYIFQIAHHCLTSVEPA